MKFSTAFFGKKTRTIGDKFESVVNENIHIRRELNEIRDITELHKETTQNYRSVIQASFRWKALSRCTKT